MLRLFLRSVTLSACLIPVVFLAGCGVGMSFPDVPAASSELPVGPIQGSNYGGHAPLVGAHVFVLEGTPSAGGYYQPAKSLLSASYSGNYPTALESAATAVNGDYYVTTDAHGDFSVTGDYTCTSGDPVYLYAEGGNPETNPLNYFQVYITQAVVAGTGPYTFTFTTTQNANTTNLLYQGETVVLSGFSGALAALNGTSQTVLGNASLTTTSFQISTASNYGIANNTYAIAGIATQNMPIVNNPAVVNLAVLGVCGDNSATNFTSLPFVYMNEVSTVAAAYALAGFFPPPGNANLVVAGAAAANLSVPTSDTLALTGLQDAARTASQLYDIGGSNTACTGLGCDGETHIARTTTPVGAGAVPQSLIDTLGNILANCVDSANTSVVTASESAQCSTLFADTLSAGTSGTRPIDTATAAIDMAHNPWANANALVSLPTGNAPFQPILASANDLSIGILFTPAHVGNPQGIAVDGSGQVWYTNFSTGYLTTLTPLGAVQYNNAPNSGDQLGYVTIDPFGAAWFGDITAKDMEKINAAGTYIGAYGNNIDYPYGIAADGIGHIYVENLSPQSVNEFTNAGVLTTTPANPLAGASSCNTLNSGNWHADHVAVSNLTSGDYDLWYTSEWGDFVCIVNASTGALVHQVIVNATQGQGNTYSPEFIAIDANNTAWFPDQFHNGMNKVTSAGAITNPGGVTLSGAFGSAVDGAGNIFVSNRTSADIAEYSGTTSAAVSAVRYEGAGNAPIMTDPLNLATDPSGNLWIADYTGSKIEEFVGIAAPTYTPLSTAASVGKLGAKP